MKRTMEKNYVSKKEFDELKEQFSSFVEQYNNLLEELSECDLKRKVDFDSLQFEDELNENDQLETNDGEYTEEDEDIDL